MLVFYSGEGMWHLSSAGKKHVANETGIFTLNWKNEKEIRYKGYSKITSLLPCYTHSHGVKYEGYTDKDDIHFEIHGDVANNRGKRVYQKDIVEEQPIESLFTEAPELMPKAETNYLHITAALLDYILKGVGDKDKHPSFRNQADLIESIVSHYQGFSGLSKRNLEEKFSLAKKSLE